jgi:hypothetical protein
MAVRMMIFWVQTNILSSSSALKVEIVCFSEILLSTYKSTWRQNPEEHHYWKRSLFWPSAGILYPHLISNSN